jgi:hypothetical protein
MLSVVLREDRPQRRGGERPLRLAQVEVEIFELPAPAAAEGALDARAGGPSGLYVLEGCGGGPDVALLAGALKVRLEAPHPIAELVIVAGLAAGWRS